MTIEFRLSNSNVLFIGIGGLAAEVCKNVFLAGVKVSIWDNTPVSQSDFSSQFFINQSDIGKKVSQNFSKQTLNRNTQNE